MNDAPPGEARSTRETQHALDSALGSALHSAIESWVEGDIGGSRDLAGPATTFEHPKWGAFVVVIEPTQRMAIEATARHRKRMRESEKPARVELPSADAMHTRLRELIAAAPTDKSAADRLEHATNALHAELVRSCTPRRSE